MLETTLYLGCSMLLSNINQTLLFFQKAFVDPCAPNGSERSYVLKLCTFVELLLFF